MRKLDFKKELRAFYAARARDVVEVDVPPLDFLMIDGRGDPNTSPEYTQAVEALFSVSYALKFRLRKDDGVDYGVMPLEGLWWSDDLAAFARGDRARWRWTMMVMQPSFVTPALVEATRRDVQARKDRPGLAKLRLETFHEGRCAQTLHVGPFSDEGPTVQRVHAYIEGRSALRGRHHEIYLSDVRRAAPARWKTIVRQPMV